MLIGSAISKQNDTERLPGDLMFHDRDSRHGSQDFQREVDKVMPPSQRRWFPMGSDGSFHRLEKLKKGYFGKEVRLTDVCFCFLDSNI